MRLLLFAGAGTSIELGVPGMLGIGEEFVDHVQQWSVEPDIVARLMAGSLDVEHLIERLDQLCGARPPLEAIGQVTDILDQVDKVRAEVEWFVQYVAERVVPKDAGLMWGSTLRAASEVELALVTTNYDRAIELAANAEAVEIDDGFGPFGNGEVASWLGFGQPSGGPLLIKLHGSTDWYAATDGTPLKLRHPMPLFGRATLRLADGPELGSALILPSREKMLTRSPYPRLSQKFLNASDSCDMAVFVGSSLRDPHVRDAAARTARRVPVFLINPSGETYGVDGVVAIRQCASSFLIATLPNALATPDPAEALTTVAAKITDDNGLLAATKCALGPDETTADRCHALDQLDALGLSLDPYLLRQLLDDPDPTVARYALGLILLSSDRSGLVEVAERSPHRGDAAFLKDVRLLREMAEQRVGGELAYAR